MVGYSALCPLFTKLKILLDEGVMQPYDFTGAVILAYLAHRRPRNFFNGKMNPCVVKEKATESTMNEASFKLSNITELVDLLSMEYICKKLAIDSAKFDEVSICMLFNRLRFSSIKQNSDNYINHSIVGWAVAKRPFRLLVHIPTPMEVLRMQAVGERVVTVFVGAEELDAKHVAQLHYMDGNELTVRDSFEFLAHDLKHMEHFSDPDKYLEQVGFFYRFLQMPRLYLVGGEGAGTDALSLKKLFTSVLFPGDIRLWHELENCYLPHLLKYVLAKLLEASKRRVACDGSAIASSAEVVMGANSSVVGLFHQQWKTVLDYLVPSCADDDPHVYAVLINMSTRILHPQSVLSQCSPGDGGDVSTVGGGGSVFASVDASVGASYTDCANLFSASDGELVRKYFQGVGEVVRQTHLEAAML